jgi:hypothetical protein
MKKFTSPLIIIALSVVSYAAALLKPEFFSGWYPALNRELTHLIGKTTGIVPFSLFELTVYVLPVLALIYVVRKRRMLKKTLFFLLNLAACLLLTFVWLYGIVYLMPAPGERAGFAGYNPNADELYKTAKHYREILNNADVTRGENGRTERQPLKNYNAAVINGYNRLSEKFDFIKANPAPAKGLALSIVQSYMGISGIYIPWFAEANVNTDTPPQNLPATVAHELAHRQGAAREEEANFWGIMACMNSGDPNVEYSGAFLAYTYLSNALADADFIAWVELWEGLNDEVREDLFGVREHYEQYEGPINDLSEAINDSYLKAMQQEEGVKSYGRVVDLLVAEYMG